MRVFMVTEILKRISERKARIGVVGLGYVGLPLTKEFINAGFNVLGFDVDMGKIKMLKKSQSYIKHIDSELLGKMNSTGRFDATNDFSKSSSCDAIIICVPTPLRKTKDPDMSFIVSACQEVAQYFHAGMLVILESTTYPGTTDEVVLPVLAKSGL